MTKRLFLILFLSGMLGVVSLLLIDLSALAALIPRSTASDIPPITPLIKVISLIQPTVLLFVAVMIGIALAPKVGLSAPVAESIAAGGSWVPALKSQVVPGLVGGVVGGIGIVLTSAVFTPFFMKETVERLHTFFSVLPIPTRLLYGGITEELLLRWGFMTLVVWITWRVIQKGVTKPTTISFVVGILVSSFIFGVGHLPVAFALLPEINAAVITFVIIGNSIFGVVAGYLYWKFGLESAVIAHMITHVVLSVASHAGAYF